jgi:hypothetical protein
VRVRISTIGAALAIGVAMNVLVGTRLANIAVTGREAATLPSEEAARLWARHVGTEPRMDRLRGWRDDFDGVRHIGLFEDGDPLGDIWEECMVRQCGWPCLAFEGVMIVRFDTFKQVQTARERGMLRLPDALLRTLGYEHLYYRPVVPGLVINSALYGSVTLLVLLWLGAVRRRSRLDRGRCPQCAYDLHASRHGAGDAIVCSECGTSVARRELDRPRQVLRGWMPLVSRAPLTTHSLQGYGEPLLRPVSLAGLAMAVAFLYAIGLVAYRDRSPRARRTAALLGAIALAGSAYIGMFALILRFGPM